MRKIKDVTHWRCNTAQQNTVGQRMKHDKQVNLRLLWEKIMFSGKYKLDLLSYASVGRQGERPHGGLQLLLSGGGAAATAAGDWPDLDVELLGLVVVEIGITRVEVVVLLLRAAYRERGAVKENKL